MHAISIVAAQAGDWQTFLALAAAEGWRVPQNEIAFHRHAGNSLACALRRGEETLGFATAVPHRKSGWIGNLLIRPDARGRGFGAQIFDAALAGLRQGGVQSLWLTASRQGEALYRRRGFHPCARVSRWVRAAGGEGRPVQDAVGAAEGFAADRAVWRESRQPLLAHLSAGNVWLRRGNSIALLQRDTDRQVIGPWLQSGGAKAPQALLPELVAVAEPGKELVLDLVDSPEIAEDLAALGFTCTGGTLLMGWGGAGSIRLDRLYALASLGSIG